MTSGSVSWCFFLSFLLLLCACMSRARVEVCMPVESEITEPQQAVSTMYDQNNEIESEAVTMKYHVRKDIKKKCNPKAGKNVTVKYDSEQDAAIKNDQTHPATHKNHIDPLVMVFFHLKDLKIGKRFPLYFRGEDSSSPSPPLLTREDADTIPFSSKELPSILHYFSIKSGSPQAEAITNSLRHCETNPIMGETKHCATSLDSMLDFAQSIFGLKTQFKGLNTVHLHKPTNVLQNYTVLRVPIEMSPSKVVACHTISYPYRVYYCHSVGGETKVLKVSLGGDNGEREEAVAVCHMDTSHWSPSHVSFRLLGIEPGTCPVCHFLPADNIVWIPKSTSAF